MPGFINSIAIIEYVADLVLLRYYCQYPEQ